MAESAVWRAFDGRPGTLWIAEVANKSLTPGEMQLMVECGISETAFTAESGYLAPRI
jgi:hypothetical protein